MTGRYDRRVNAWVSWCDLNGLDPWPKDPSEADARLADWLYWRYTALGNGLATLREVAQAVAHGCSARSLEDPRGQQVAELRDAIRRISGEVVERRKIDPITSDDIQSTIIGALIESSAPSPAALKRALALELGHTHGVPTERLFRITPADLVGQSVQVDGRLLEVETPLDVLRDQRALYGSVRLLETLFDGRRLADAPIALHPVVGTGLTESEARWARFGANPAGRRSLLWTTYLLVGNAWALRHADIVRARVDGVAEHPDRVDFTVYGSKTISDQVALRRSLEHVHAPDRLCPACMLAAWTQWRRVGEGVTSGPLFVAKDGAATEDAPVTAAAARAALRRAVAGSELADRRIGTRSIRVGAATELAAAGVPLADIMAVTSHRSVSEAVRYVRLLSPRFQPHLDV